MAHSTDIVLIVGSGPNAMNAQEWPREWFDRIVAINNAWRVREDWDDLVFPEDFPRARWPERLAFGQRLIEADQFVPTQNAYGGFVYGGGTMAFTAAYWALHALRPTVMAFIGCDMVYPTSGKTHFYGQGAADPLRADVTLQDLGAKSARLGLIAASQGCHCVNLSQDQSRLLFQRLHPSRLRDVVKPTVDALLSASILNAEDALGYFVPTGRYWENSGDFDATALAAIDSAWLSAWQDTIQVRSAA